MAKEQEIASAERLAAEGGIASDENTVAELEIEANEGPVEEHVNEPDESAAAEGGSGEICCPIMMGYFDAHRCGRKLHVAPDGVDITPVCLMHSKDPCKQSGPLFDSFLQEFEEILQSAGDGKARFDQFVFPLLDFSGRKFQAICWFAKAIFTQDASFAKATFAKDANFHLATFVQNASFNDATLTQNADFFCASFIRNAYFSGATFKQTARFVDTKFHGTAYWQGSRFLDQAEFRRTKFHPQVEGEPSAVFALAKFSKPGEIVFDDVDLRHALFHNSDVSQVWFTASVRWGKRKDNRGLVVIDETIFLKPYLDEELQRDGQLDHRAVAQIYQQLKKNYDSRLDYWTANEFHFGEMEMKRLAVPAAGRLLWLRQWWHPRLSFVALYRWASDYGNSYGKPLLWLLAILLAATLMFPITGLELKQAISASSASVTYSSVWNRQDSWTNNFWAEAKLIGKSGITAIDTATFQRTPEYTPVYPRGRVVAIVETLLTSSLFALFLLAIRRQFRR
jgi:hypothetical protein